MSPTTKARPRREPALATALACALFLACAAAVSAQSPAQMTGPPVPAAWRDKGGPGTVAAILNLTAPRLGELTDAQAGGLEKALLATLAPDVPGLDVRRIRQQGTAVPVVLEKGGPAAAAADRMRVAVDLVAPQARLSELLRRMAAVSENAELAGSLRAAGLYDLTDARFDSYELRAGGRAAGGDGKEDKGGGKDGRARPQDGGAVIELPPLPPLPKPVPVPTVATSVPTAGPPPSAAAAPEGGAAPPPVTASIEVSGTAPGGADPTPERRAALARAVAVLAGVPEGAVSVSEEGLKRRALLQDPTARPPPPPWARRFRVEVAPADPAQAASARAALERLATPAGAADLRAALASQGWDGLTGAGLTGVNGRKVDGVGTGRAPILPPAATTSGGEVGGGGKKGGGSGKLAGIIVGCLLAATLVGLALAYALAYFLGWCRCLGVGVKGAADEEKGVGGGGGGTGWWKKKAAAASAGGSPPPATASAYKVTTDDAEAVADLRAAAAAAAAGNKAADDGAAAAAAAAAVADDARRDLASIAAAGVTSLRRLASGAKDRTGRPGSAGGSGVAAVARGAGAAPAPPASGDEAATAAAVMELARKGAPLAGAFALERGSLVPDTATVTVKAREVGGAGRPAVATFFVDDAAHARAAALSGRLPDGAATPAVLASYGRGDAPGGAGLPPVIVREAPDYSLDAWTAKRYRTPDARQRLAVLSLVAKPVAAFAAKNLVHGALSPGAVQWFADDNAMKLGGTDAGAWGAKGSPLPAHPVPAFAAPEVIAALARAEEAGGGGGGGGAAARPTVAAHPAQDAWSLGMLAYLVLTDSPLIPVDATASEVAAALGTSGQLPWERPGGALEALEDPAAAAAIASLLRREPRKRASAASVLGGGLFKGLAGAPSGTTGTPRRK